jgi:hypothetical protein
MSEVFQSSHILDFEVTNWIMGPYIQFRIGTCHGLWNATGESYDILAIDNKEKGNGHLEDVFEWFENSCRRDNRDLKVLEVWNQKFKKHLIEKRGFIDIGGDNVIKKIRK